MTNLSIFEKLWPYYYKYAEICKISPNLVWNEEKLKCSAKIPLKVCDTSISMISFYKINFFWFWLWFHFIILSYARYGDNWQRLRYLKISCSCRVGGKSTFLFCLICLNITTEFEIFETLFIVQYPMIKLKNNWVCCEARKFDEKVQCNAKSIVLF